MLQPYHRPVCEMNLRFFKLIEYVMMGYESMTRQRVSETPISVLLGQLESDD